MNLLAGVKKQYIRLGIIVSSVILLTSCSLYNDKNIANNKSEATLADLVKSANQQALAERKTLANALTYQQRQEKLARIYQSILTLEPDQNVRAQIQHRMVQLTVEKHQHNETLENQQVLEQLVTQYQHLLTTYPERAENEKIQYQLAKTYDLLGQAKNSILTLEALLKRYPETKYYLESQFRRAELYYNLEQYPLALEAYQAVLAAKNNENYQLNSLYMSGWSLFKLNRLAQADQQFIAVLNHIVAEHEGDKVGKQLPGFSFAQLDGAQQSLAMDTQRVLSISLSQQQQAKSLVALVTASNKALHTKEAKANLAKFDHILFDNLANFLFEKSLKHDAMLTYQAYLAYAPDTLSAARFNLTLIELNRKQNQFATVKALKQRFIRFYGLNSVFWQQANAEAKQEVSEPLTDFSLAHSRHLYAKAQIIGDDKARIMAFTETAAELKKYLAIIAYRDQQTQTRNLAIQEHYLFADANFEAAQYQTAFSTYQLLAYDPQYSAYIGQHKQTEAELTANNSDEDDALPLSYIQKESAYAAIIALKALLTSYENVAQVNLNTLAPYQALLKQKREVDDLYIQHYGEDKRAKLIALKAAEYAYQQKNLDDVMHYSQFILSAYGIEVGIMPSAELINQLDKTALKQVTMVSQLIANMRYQLKQYPQAEQDYLLALALVSDNTKKKELNELIASSIYQQAKLAEANNSQLAIEHYLRLGQRVPDSKYRVNAEFDAANLLIASKNWPQAVKVLTAFQLHFKQHAYTESIPAKLALCYEQLSDWPNAAKQLLIMVAQESNPELKREAQYTAADYYLQAGDIDNAIVHFRTYAHQYPQPHAVAQEVRFKMSEFYRQTNEPNKRYYWYRKLIRSHQKQLKVAKNKDFGRSNYLASYAAFHLGQAHQQTFNWTKLKVPLNKSLKKKQLAMKQAIHYYQLVFDWQLAEFVPQANYSIGQLYRRLAQDVMRSERPKDLDELALEEYEFLLEEIAYPFEEKAIQVHQANAERAWQNIYDQWVQKSLLVLAEIDPAKFDKFEKLPEVIDVAF